MQHTDALSRLLAQRQRPASLMARVKAVLALRRQRRRLNRLDPQALADIGLTRGEAEREAARPLWDVPAHWRR